MNIICFNGETAPRASCRKIKGEFYKVGDQKIKDSGHCYKINNRYYRINSGYIDWNYEDNEYQIINTEQMIYGIVGSKGEEGYFTRNLSKNVEVRKYCPHFTSYGDADICINDEIASLYADFQSEVDGYYYKLDSYDSDNRKKSQSLHVGLKKYYYSKIGYRNFDSGIYNISEIKNKDQICEEYEKTNLKIEDYTKEINKILNGLSFGYEEETQAGRIPENILFKYSVVPLKDGSISGHEYTSIPYYNEKGIQSFIDMFSTHYPKYCIVDQNCSLHYHIGSIFKDMNKQEKMLSLLSIYLLFFYLQTEIFEIIPPYKRSNEYFKTKKDFKNHCQKIETLGLIYNKIYNENGSINDTELERAFNILFRFVNDGVSQNEISNFENRRSMKAGEPKWHIHNRYYALNLYNAFFSKSETVEFRMMSPTTNIHKALFWLILCVGIVRFAIKYRQIILTPRAKKFYLSDIVDELANNFGENNLDANFAKNLKAFMYEFMDNRREHYIELLMRNDIYGREFKDDVQFKLKNTLL